MNGLRTWLSLGVVFLCSLTVEGAFQCLQCTGVSEPHDCQNVVTCEEGEKCYTDFYVTEQGFLYFDVGCQPDRVCNVLNGRKRHLPEKRQYDRSHLCEECCSSDYCNRRGCSDNSSIKLNRTVCYTCDDVVKPEDCARVQVCNEAEECYLTHQLTTLLEFRYKMGCRKKKICSLASASSSNFGHPKFDMSSGFGKKRQGLNLPYDECTYCCNTNFCNNKTCEHGAPVSTPKPTTKIPTTHATKPTTHRPTTARPTPPPTQKPTTHKATQPPTQKPTTHRATQPPTQRPTTHPPTHSSTTKCTKTTTHKVTTTRAPPPTTHKVTTHKPTPPPTTHKVTTHKPTPPPTTHKVTTHKPTPPRTTPTTQSATTTPTPFSCYDCHYTPHDIGCNHTGLCDADKHACYEARVDGSLKNGNCFYRFGCMDIGDCRTFQSQLGHFQNIPFFDNQTIENIYCCEGADCNSRPITQRPVGCSEIVDVP